jgi:hypothetical protein
MHFASWKTVHVHRVLDLLVVVRRMNEDPTHSCPNAPFSANANGNVLLLFVRLPDEDYTHKKWCKEERRARL